jgi:hypothetical protein
MQMDHGLLELVFTVLLAFWLPLMSDGVTFIATQPLPDSVAVQDGTAADAATLEAQSQRYPLAIQFMVKGKAASEFSAEVQVDIHNQSGKLLVTTTAHGHLLLVNLPPGTYLIRADLAGESEVHHVRLLPNRHKRVIFEWNEARAMGCPRWADDSMCDTPGPLTQGYRM